LEEEQPGSLVFRVRSEQTGWLLLSDTWYPGWRAFVDGVEAPTYRANYLFRSLSVSAGEHLVRFDYCPVSFYTGGILSFLTFLSLAGISYKFTRPRQANPTQ
jgi:uncharacterized membrane protein YfhO